MKLQCLVWLALAGLTCGCGGDAPAGGAGEPAAEPPVSQSPVVLTAIPEVLITKQLYGKSTLRIAPSSSQAKFFYRGATSSIDFPNGAILAARERAVGGVLYVLLSVVDRTTETCTIYRVHDTNGDWLPEASTKLALGNSASRKSYVTSISAGRHGMLYLLDRRCQDVFPFEDTDSDGWEDVWSTSPIVRSEDFSYVLNARAVFGAGSNPPTVRVYTQETPLELGMRVPIEYRDYSDADQDGVAEIETIYDQSGAPPRFGIPPQEEVLKIQVDYARGGGSATVVVEAWSLDSQGAEVTLLGSVTLGSSLIGTITLSSSLSEGDRVALKKSGATARSVSGVWPDGPTIIGADPSRVVEGESTTIVVTGHRFTSNSRVWLRESDGNQIMLETTYVDSETLQAQVPANALSSAVPAYLCVFDQDTSGDFTVSAVNFLHLDVCTGE